MEKFLCDLGKCSYSQLLIIKLLSFSEQNASSIKYWAIRKQKNQTITMFTAPNAVKSHFLPRINVIWGGKFLFTVLF